METMVGIAAIALLWWWLARTPAPRDTPTSTPATDARTPGSRAVPWTARPAEPLEDHIRRREDAAFVEGMVIGHYVWPRQDVDGGKLDGTRDRDELEELALTFGDDAGHDPLDLELEEFEEFEEDVDAFDDGYDEDDLEDW